ncbi:LTA synthase family protein [Rhodopila sp.]|uniref:LTA synthase family protein n=1 Tax=Rhodopila sp. TaxID=2480087 RepID=UPI003D0BA9E3
MVFQLTTAALLLLLCALFLRWHAGAWAARPPFWVMALDVAPLLIGAALFAALTARPLFGALVVAALAGGLVGADVVKRQVLREPVVFADRAELLEVVRHPEFYLPFAGTGLVLGAAAAIAAVAGAVAWALPPVWPWSPWPPLAALLVTVAAFALPGWPPLLARLQRLYEGLAPSRDPGRDTARWGMLACFAIHATLARAERPARRATAAVLRSPPDRWHGPVVMAQLESFFDPRRLHVAMPPNLLPGFDACRAAAAAAGRLAVPTWGANTIRTEFAALTGLGSVALGLDRFNPYERFARTRIDALAWHLQTLGMRTVCLHPFDRRFYGRNRAIPALGFQRFIGPEAFSTAGRAEAFVNDAALARHAAEILADAGPDLFLFVISVGNHGPWLADRGAEDAVRLPDPLQGLPEAAALRRYLGGLRRTDAFFPVMTDALRAAPGRGLLLAYGDHQPSLPGLFAALGHRDTMTDYVLWDAEPVAHAPFRSEILSVEALPQLLLDRLGGSYIQQKAAE